MTVSLQPNVQQFIDEKVRAGQFASTEEAVNSLLEQVREQESLSPADIGELRAEVDVGCAQADRGEFVEFSAESVIAEQRKALGQRTKGK